MTLAQRIRLILSGDTAAEFARGGGGSKSAKGKAGKSSKKAKGATQAGSGGACCKTESGKFAPGNNYGSLAGKGNSQRAAATRVKQRLALKSKAAEADKAARRGNVEKEATRRGNPIGNMVARSKTATAMAARVQVAKEKAALEKKQARNARARAKRAAVKERAEKAAALQATRESATRRGEEMVAKVASRKAAAEKGKATRAEKAAKAKKAKETNETRAYVIKAMVGKSKTAVEAAKDKSADKGRAASLKRMTDKSRVASGKAGARNAAKKRAAEEQRVPVNVLTRGIGGREPDLRNVAPAGPTSAAMRARESRDNARDAMVRKSREAAQGARLVVTKKAKAADKAAESSKPATPVKPPPASVESKPISDPVRLKAESAKMDEAFDKAPGAKSNFVTLDALHKTMPHLSREEFVAVVNKGRDDGKYGLDSHEGLTGPLTPAQRDAGIEEAGSRLVYISRRDVDASYVPRTVVRSERPRGDERRYGR